MNKFFILSLLCLLNFSFLFGHEGHKKKDDNMPKQESVQAAQDQPAGKQYQGMPQSWIQWIGGFHFIFLHFPIALIAMTAISELLFTLYKRPIFDYSSRFMLIAAAVLAVPTAILGLTYSYTASYSGLLEDFVWWHMWFGFATAIFVIFVAFLRERSGRSAVYYACLFLLFLLVNVTGFLGAGMTFGPYQMYPPLETKIGA